MINCQSGLSSKMYQSASGAVWTCEVFDTDKNLGKFTLTAETRPSEVTKRHNTSCQQNLKLWFSLYFSQVVQRKKFPEELRF